MKKWKCTICNYIHEGEEPPAKCPVCRAPASKFVLIEPSPDEAGALKLKELEKQIAEQKLIVEANKSKAVKMYEVLQRFLVKQHAHPISVHFPNGVLPLAVILFVLSLILKSEILLTVGFANIFFVMLTLPFVLFTGYTEWFKKYNRAMTPLFQIKIIAAIVTTTTCVFNVLWYIIDPCVLSSSLSWLFILLNIAMLGSAGVAGHLGGKLVFKD